MARRMSGRTSFGSEESEEPASVLPLSASTQRKRSSSQVAGKENKMAPERAGAGQTGTVDRDRDGFLIPRPLAAKTQRRKRQENSEKFVQRNPRARRLGRLEGKALKSVDARRRRAEEELEEDAADAGDAGEEDEAAESDEEEVSSSSTSEDDLEDEDYEEEEKPGATRKQREREEARATREKDFSTALPMLVKDLALERLPARESLPASGSCGGREERRKRGRGTSGSPVCSAAQRKKRRKGREEVLALGASLETLVSVAGVLRCPDTVAEAIAAELSEATRGDSSERRESEGERAHAREQEGEEEELGGRGEGRRGRGRQAGRTEGVDGEERERRRDETTAERMGTLAAAVVNMLLEAGGLPSPLFHREHLAPLLLQSFAVLRRACTRRKSLPSGLSRADSLAIPPVVLVPPPPTSSAATAARRILQRGVCRLFAQLLEERTAGVSRLSSASAVSSASEEAGVAGREESGHPTEKREKAAVGERQHCALLELPRHTFQRFRALLKSLFVRVTLTCQREGCLEARGGLGGLLGLLAGLAGSGARRIRAAATLAVLGIAEGLAASLGSLHAEESKFHQQLLQLQATYAVPALPSAGADSSWGARVVEDIRARLEGAERNARVSVQLLEVLAAESLAFRSRDVCPLIRAETLQVIASCLLPAVPSLVLGSLPFQAAVLSSLSEAPSGKATTAFQAEALLSSVEIFSVALSLLLPRTRRERPLSGGESEGRSCSVLALAPNGAGDRGDAEVDEALRQKAETLVKLAKPVVLLLACGAEETAAVAALHALRPAATATRLWRETRSIRRDRKAGETRRRRYPATAGAGECDGEGDAEKDRDKRAGEGGGDETWRISEEDAEKLLTAFWTSKGMATAAAAAPILDDLFLGGHFVENARVEKRAESSHGSSVERDLRLLLSFCLAHLPRSPSSPSSSCASSPAPFFACAGRVVTGFWDAVPGVKQPKKMLDLLLRGEAEGDARSGLQDGERTLLLRFCERSFELLQTRQREAQRVRSRRNFAKSREHKVWGKVRNTERAREEAKEAPCWGCEAAWRAAQRAEKRTKHAARDQWTLSDVEDEGEREKESEKEREEREEREERLFLIEGTETVFANLQMLLRIHQADRDELQLLLASVYWATFPPPCLEFHLSQRADLLFALVSFASSPSSSASSAFALPSFSPSRSPLSAACRSPVSICAQTSSFFSASGTLAALAALCLGASDPLAVRTAFSCLANLGMLLAPLEEARVVDALAHLHANVLAAAVANVEALQALLFTRPAAKLSDSRSEREGEQGGEQGGEAGRGGGFGEPLMPLDSQREDAEAPPVFDLMRAVQSRRHREMTEMNVAQLEANLLRLAAFYSTCLSLTAEPSDAAEKGAEGPRNSLPPVPTPAATETAVAVLHMRVMATMTQGGEEERASEAGGETTALPADLPEVPTPRLVLHASDLLVAIYSHLAYRSLFLYARLTTAIRRVAHLETCRIRGAALPALAREVAREEEETHHAEGKQRRKRTERKNDNNGVLHGDWDADLEDSEGNKREVVAGVTTGVFSEGDEEHCETANGVQGKRQTEEGAKEETELKEESEEIELAHKEVLALSRELQQTLADAAVCRSRSTVLLTALLETETRPLLLFNSLFSLLTLTQVEGMISRSREVCCRSLSAVSSSSAESASTSRSPERLLPALHAYEYIPSDIESVVSAFQHFLDLLGSESALLSPENAVRRRLGRAEKAEQQSPVLPSSFFADAAAASSPPGAASLFASALSGTACAPLLAMARYDASAFSYLDSVVLSPPSPSSSMSPGSEALVSVSGAGGGQEARKDEGKEEEGVCDFQSKLREAVALGCCRLARQSCLNELRWAVGGLGASLLSVLDHPSAVAAEARLFFQSLRRQNFRLLLQLLLQTAQDLFDARLLTPLTLLLLARRRALLPESVEPHSSRQATESEEREREGRCPERRGACRLRGVGTETGEALQRQREENREAWLLGAADVELHFTHLLQWSLLASQRLSVGLLLGSQQMEMVNFWRAAIRHNRALADAVAAHARECGDARRDKQEESRIFAVEGREKEQGEEQEEDEVFQRSRQEVLSWLQEGGGRRREDAKKTDLDSFPPLQFLDFLHPFIQRGFLPTYLLNQLLGVTKELFRRQAGGVGSTRETGRRFESWESSGERRLFEALKKRDGWLVRLHAMRDARRATAEREEETERQARVSSERTQREDREKRAEDAEKERRREEQSERERRREEEMENMRREERQKRREERGDERKERSLHVHNQEEGRTREEHRQRVESERPSDRRQGAREETRQGEAREERSDREQIEAVRRGWRREEAVKPREDTRGDREAAKDSCRSRKVQKTCEEEDSEDELCARLERRQRTTDSSKSDEMATHEEIRRPGTRREAHEKAAFTGQNNARQNNAYPEAKIFSSDEEEHWTKAPKATAAREVTDLGETNLPRRRKPEARKEKTTRSKKTRKTRKNQEDETTETDNKDENNKDEDSKDEDSEDEKPRSDEEAAGASGGDWSRHSCRGEPEEVSRTVRTAEVAEIKERVGPTRKARETHRVGRSAGPRAKPQEDDLWSFEVSPVSRPSNLPARGPGCVRAPRSAQRKPTPSFSSAEEKEMTGSELDVWSDDDGSLLEEMARVCSLQPGERKAFALPAGEAARPQQRPRAGSEESVWAATSQATSFAEDLLEF
ncbi:hypothetical protein TGDOM2_231200 [Toxoplasma gondii GAB2-2007-GAL-DOM2]|uniref:Uncharacterized protein n=6 Tax=Toxoplasma gondii TaxID=5811 RepID=S7WIE5_TOXGG|nr:hypothetical protein TGGT1_231200 [Toxoplasma gondii GT1]KAF4641743.1 hypothetical protein TGRH88_075540 [Toxoplasma gondii]KFG48485.1 hypothetical protein TGDOM2_231200 [Toxoplasma gondii GAB2-2007-GAL-DOM2]KFG55417.1 hypothetical protein TGFOU_231200 [Toxoplasma gondii FOU]PUA92752.1 hypothetical protein TGBR9_231200 [Toxoplasma gondii TgCATBr9]RQX75890.1 hypothetical protein TGCAST_231200 [Toxoplasma gondii CAST]